MEEKRHAFDAMAPIEPRLQIIPFRVMLFMIFALNPKVNDNVIDPMMQIHLIFSLYLSASRGSHAFNSIRFPAFLRFTLFIIHFFLSRRRVRRFHHRDLCFAFVRFNRRQTRSGREK